MKSHVSTIAEMLRPEIQYVIPHFQRAYAWRREDHWVPLWDDIESVANNLVGASENDAVPPHFVGPIVIQRREDQADSPESYIIVDGQQRLTTIIIVLRAFANACDECGLQHMAQEFLDYIQKRDFREYSPKVRHLNRANYNQLKLILEMNSTGTDVVSAMSQCLDFFHTKAVEYIRKDSSTEQNVTNLLDVLRYKLETAVLTLDPIEQPNKVFETLNARGEPLRQSELIKNTVMYEGNVVEDEGRAQLLWEREMGHAYYSREEDEGQRLDQFFADWLSSIATSRIPIDRTSTQFRHYLTGAKNNGSDIDDISRKMQRAAEIYRLVRSDQFPETQPSTTRLIAAGTEFFMPVVLWLWAQERHIDLGQRQAVLRMIESYVVRRILTSKAVGDTTARNITQMLRYFETSMDGDISLEMAASAWMNLPSNQALQFPTDTEVLETVGNQPHQMNTARRNMVLHALENHLRLENGRPPVRDRLQPVRLIPTGDVGLANYPIEGRATQARLERRIETLEQLGNFSLVNTRLTTREYETTWQDKRESLHNKGDNVLLNETLLSSDRNSFTEQDIVDRSQRFAQLCISIWPREL